MDRKQLVKFISIPLLSSLLILPMDVNARSIEDLTQEKEQLEKQLQELDGESISQQVKLDGLEARKEQLRTGTIALQEKIDALTSQMAGQQVTQGKNWASWEPPEILRASIFTLKYTKTESRSIQRLIWAYNYRTGYRMKISKE